MRRTNRSTNKTHISSNEISSFLQENDELLSTINFNYHQNNNNNSADEEYEYISDSEYYSSNDEPQVDYYPSLHDTILSVFPQIDQYITHSTMDENENTLTADDKKSVISQAPSFALQEQYSNQPENHAPNSEVQKASSRPSSRQSDAHSRYDTINQSIASYKTEDSLSADTSFKLIDMESKTDKSSISPISSTRNISFCESPDNKEDDHINQVKLIIERSPNKARRLRFIPEENEEENTSKTIHNDTPTKKSKEAASTRTPIKSAYHGIPKSVQRKPRTPAPLDSSLMEGEEPKKISQSRSRTPKRSAPPSESYSIYLDNKRDIITSRWTTEDLKHDEEEDFEAADLEIMGKRKPYKITGVKRTRIDTTVPSLLQHEKEDEEELKNAFHALPLPNPSKEFQEALQIPVQDRLLKPKKPKELKLRPKHKSPKKDFDAFIRRQVALENKKKQRCKESIIVPARDSDGEVFNRLFECSRINRFSANDESEESSKPSAKWTNDPRFWEPKKAQKAQPFRNTSKYRSQRFSEASQELTKDKPSFEERSRWDMSDMLQQISMYD